MRYTGSSTGDKTEVVGERYCAYVHAKYRTDMSVSYYHGDANGRMESMKCRMCFSPAGEIERVNC